jgi:hypothetical protein
MHEIKQALKQTREQVKSMQGALHGSNLQQALNSVLDLLEATNQRLDVIDTKMSSASVSGDTVVWGS